MLVVLRAWFFLTVAYVIGFAIYVLFAVVYLLISEGRLPDFTRGSDKEGFFAILFIWVMTYFPSLFMFWYLPSRSFFRKAILSHMLLTTIWFLFVLVQIGSFLDSLLFAGIVLGVPFVLGLVIANWLMHAIAGLSQVKVKPPKTLDFAEYGKWVVVGQDYAIETIQKVLTANTKLADRGDPRRNRILASFLFVGPTGVGKTETAKALASWLSQEGYGFIRIDANQFATEETVWTLLGSPKGYIGSETPGLLPSAISQNPKQVILIDEIEKADQRLYQAMLQLLDEGYVIERSTGYAYYLSRAIVIFTSNLENQRIAEIMEMLSDPIEIDIAVRKTLEGAVIEFSPYRSFKITPEFLGRMDAVVPFRSLRFEDLVEIAYRELRRLGENVSIDFARELTQKYYPIAREYGVRYFLKKITEDVLTQ
ncbi:MAG: AAA family ATPase [Thermocrinis sp.]|uniref:AAA family ATPase n=1 Tax=Thermocrinis sp. TaxID=2024383 RepID=UPI003BFBEAD8